MVVVLDPTDAVVDAPGKTPREHLKKFSSILNANYLPSVSFIKSILLLINRTASQFCALFAYQQESRYTYALFQKQNNCI